MRYATANAFRMALEERINRLHKGDSAAIQRLRKKVAFERLLARLQAPSDSPWYLKGAFALDLRFGNRARATMDLDLGIELSLGGDVSIERAEIAQRLMAAADSPLEDFFVFTIPAGGQEILQEPTARAYRFLVRSLLAGRSFEDFKVDVGVGVALVAPAEGVPESDTLAFAGIIPGRFRAVPIPQHFAEKIHALTRPREEGEKTRVKDLVDIALILELNPPEPKAARIAIESVFEKRATHPIPPNIPDPPASWTATYATSAAMIDLPIARIDDAIGMVRQYWMKVFP